MNIADPKVEIDLIYNKNKSNNKTKRSNEPPK